ncbi:MAG: ABC transporter substrate-binding protein [Oceanicoccus sp.]|uniref:substrate-binding domain-containing protein n=1 Tax=Oceanicoccus sp. TaxID=2691044 RepID=UPI00262FA245|nr:substrate-binding domain-containing protein [Oceanicoccus sp.]MCP3907627.1 ABC transporter substrate-binding protein [Oceanicoccus sp.]MDG1773587.1 substrate-binding domain-containing protein [Oceanicoccus sp.]
MKNLIKKIPHNTLIILLALALTACQSFSGNSIEAKAEGQLKVISSGGFAAAYDVLGPQFEQQTGIKLETAYGSSSGGAYDSIPVRLARGEVFDVIILSQSSLNNLNSKGEVDSESRVDLVHSVIGMAVKSGAEKPDITTKEAFIETLLEAESIGYSASASGTYLSGVLFPEMGIWDRIKPKSKRILSERVASVVARGEVEIGFQQVSEILPIEGVDYVGQIPAELQKTTTFSAAITKRALNKSDAKRLLDYLSSRQVAPIIVSTGLKPVVLESNIQ